MHEYFVDLHNKTQKDKAQYHVALGPIYNNMVAPDKAYGNCAYYCALVNIYCSKI